MPGLRSVYLTLVMLVLSAGAGASDLKTLDGSAEIETGKRYEIELEEEIHFHRTGSALDDLCRSHDVDGCTDFPREQLDCRCVSGAGGWVIVASARLRAEIYVSAPRILVHERQHLSDLRSGLDAHLSRVLALSYPQELVCEMKASLMSTPQYLRDVMNRLRKESNRKFRCS